MSLSGEIWIITPTHNEVANIVRLIGQATKVVLSAYLVIVDDASPNGTAKIVNEVASVNKRVHLTCNPAKLGYALAMVTGLKFALTNGASVLGYLDVDLSHDPQELPLLLTAIENGADIAIGSRYVAGGK